MWIFWPLLKALLECVQPQRICEIGSDTGKTTRLVLGYCDASGAFLEVIDPLPKYDVAGVQFEFPQRCRFHAQPSLCVLPELPACDVYLLDGDHNYYTVSNELRMIHRTTAGRALIVLHDTAWPYARRDLYYDPSQIPEDFRQPYARAGMLPDQIELIAGGGLNAHLDNAVTEHTPRNGVLTAVEDFLEVTGSGYLLRNLPIWHGLAVLAPASRLDASDTASRLLDSLNLDAELADVLRAVERQRVEALIELKKCKALLARDAKGSGTHE